MKLIVIDNRRSLTDKCTAAGIEAIWGDYFDEALKIPRHVLCTASNRSFTFGGGIDRQFIHNFPFYCEAAQKRQGANQRIGNICFTITVGAHLASNAQLVRDAIAFAMAQTGDDETLCICGLGTGIGLLPEEEFVAILAKALDKK